MLVIWMAGKAGLIPGLMIRAAAMVRIVEGEEAGILTLVMPGTGEVLRGDITSQTELVLSNVRAILEAAGSSLDRVVKTNVYLDRIEDFAAMNAVYATFFPENPPARTTIEAANLPLGIGVEIDVIALEG